MKKNFQSGKSDKFSKSGKNPSKTYSSSFNSGKFKDNRDNRDKKRFSSSSQTSGGMAESNSKSAGYSSYDRPKQFSRPKKQFDKNISGKSADYGHKKYDRKPKKPNSINISVRDISPVSPIETHEDSSMIFGRNAVIELLKSDKTIDKLFVQTNQREGSITMIVAEAIRKSVPVVEVDRAKIDRMTNATSHQGVVALVSETEYCSVDDIIAVAESRNEKPFILIADKIMDAHNLGAIIRTAECAGVHGVIIPKRHSAGVSAVVGKVSAGAVFHMKIAKVANVASTIEDLKEKGIWTFASMSDSVKISDSENDSGKIETKAETKKEITDYCDADYKQPLCLIVGNEGEGLSPIIARKSDFLVNIPMHGKIQSLNVSCATAVLLYEVAKQRRH